MLTPQILNTFLSSSLELDEPIIGISSISEKQEAADPSVVKVAVSNKRIIYASRLPIPSSDSSKGLFYKHTGLYCFARHDLQSFSSAEVGELEKSENIEIMRFIENRVSVGFVLVPNYGRSVDTPGDLDYVNSGVNAFE